jgi:hypothetical protein
VDLEAIRERYQKFEDLGIVAIAARSAGDVPVLLAEVEQLKAERDSLRERFDEARRTIAGLRSDLHDARFGVEHGDPWDGAKGGVSDADEWGPVSTSPETGPGEQHDQSTVDDGRAKEDPDSPWAPGWPDEHMLEAAMGLLANAVAFDPTTGWEAAKRRWFEAYHRHLAAESTKDGT